MSRRDVGSDSSFDSKMLGSKEMPRSVSRFAVSAPLRSALSVRPPDEQRPTILPCIRNSRGPFPAACSRRGGSITLCSTGKRACRGTRLLTLASYYSSWIIRAAISAIPAVSVRRIRRPSVISSAPAATAASTSFGSSPPSGPIMIPIDWPG